MVFKHNNNLKNNSRGHGESDAGFTVVELLVVVVIIAVLTVIVISNFPQAKLQFSLSRVAYKFGQDLRRAQGMSLSYSEYKGPIGTLCQVPCPVKGYGVYVDKSNNKKYIIYADKSGNQQYDASGPDQDYTVETVNFSSTEPGIIISNINNTTDNRASINFKPPIPTTVITIINRDCTLNNTNITFALESDSTKTRIVSINTAGLIQVASASSTPCLD